MLVPSRSAIFSRAAFIETGRRNGNVDSLVFMSSGSILSRIGPVGYRRSVTELALLLPKAFSGYQVSLTLSLMQSIILMRANKMPAKETFLNQRIGSEQFEIIKTYDRSLAREAFADMDSAALDHLADSLALEQQYELSDIPSQLSR